ncbi:inactive carboxypeptidase-like protein X2 isoform X1 [Oncorhynchus keta]|uniref:inactive carboxypeptidase-like protein X2 isoform X1 n=1 Tax=Oncorhynchus keta TaxID=8018 RepID=UPI00227C0141|nr:inactive carboxypeptidase-like protein X2 isoform X1 [Oncorhynchus keta]
MYCRVGRMGGHTAVVCLVLLALCCVLLLRGGESAGGIVSIGQAVEERGMDGGMEALHGEESQDEPAKEQELTETQRQTGKAKRATEEEAAPARVRRAPEEEEGKGKKKKGKKDKKNKESKADKKLKDKGGRRGKAPTTPPPTTTTLPPTTTTEVYTEPEDEYWNPDDDKPATPETDSEDDYWNPDDDKPATPETDSEDEYWNPDDDKPATPETDSEDDYWNPDDDKPATPETDSEDEYWNPDDDKPATPETDSEDEYWNPDDDKPATPETDSEDEYWNPDDDKPATPETDSEDEYWNPDDDKPATPETDSEDDYWKGEEEEPAGPVVDPEDDYWKGEDPTATSPPLVVDGEVDTEDEDYWEAKYEVPENLPFPDGKEVVPTEKDDLSYAVTEDSITPPPTHESPWYEEYDYGYSGGETKKQEEEEERERQRKEKEREDRERAQQRREEEDREKAKKRPPVFKEPKKCPPLGMESHRIESDQLLASSMSHHRYSQGRARLNMQASEDEDDMHGGAWCPNQEDNIHWFEVDARKVTEFTGIITQGRDSRNESDFVTSYYVQFSNDSREWTTMNDGYSDWLFFGNSDKDTPVLNQLAEPILARYIRVIPQSWNGSCCMRLEVLGCPLPDPTSAYQRLQNEVTPVQYLDFRHHNYSDMVTLMKSVSEECPNITSMYSLGRSSNGLDIVAMVISGNPTEHEIGEPEFRYTAGLHGNEATGREMVLLLMQYLCKEYRDGNPRVRRLVEGMRTHLVPSLNPDGQEKALIVGSELSGWTTGHWTEDGHDIFHNFPDLNSVLWEAEDKGMVPKLTPNHHVKIPADTVGDDKIAVETQAIISWMESHPFVLGANFQGGERVVAYPYDNHRLTKVASTSERDRAHSRKKRQFEDEYDRGADWDRGYDREEPEDDDRNRGYQEPEEERWNRGYQDPEEDRRNRGYQEPEEDRRNRGYQEPEEERWNRGYQQPEEDRQNRGYQEPEEERWNRGYQQPEEDRQNRELEEEWRGHGYGHREEEEEDDRGGHQEAEPEDEPRTTADASFFRWLAISYASTHLSMTYTAHGSCHGDDITGGVGIINRAKWKPITGSMNDFSYLHTNCLELSMFLGCDKFPHQSELVIEWEKNREAMLTFMEQVHRGIRGVVKDNEGNPITNATVSVEGVNHDVTTAVTGDYWRLLNPGEYRVTVRAEGFTPLTKLCVVGYEPGATTCSFNLAKSNWDRIKQIMALHGNKPIRLLSHGNGGTRRNTASNGNSRVVHNNGAAANEPETSRMRQQNRRLGRLRRLRQQKLMRSTTTLPPTTTPVPTTTEAEPTTAWYDSWLIGEGQTSAPEGFTDSILDYNYEIDDY